MYSPRRSASLCFMPINEQMVIMPYFMPLLPQFHGMENENLHSHIKDFVEVYHIFQKRKMFMDLMKLKLFPFTL